MSYRKKLIEVALPLDAINDASAYDKMPGIGPHPKGIHQWWARLPLPCARAILFASLVDDPSSDPIFGQQPEAVQNKERERLFKITRSLLQKKIHRFPEAFEKAQIEIVRSCEGVLPQVLDPFAGGGSIPLEAQRLGLRAYASDLNPVAVLINKAVIEIPSKFANRPPVYPVGADGRPPNLFDKEWRGAAGLAEDVRYYGKWMRNEAEKRIDHLYPKVKLPKEYGGSEATVVAWLWARTVKCPNPACNATMPLVRSFWLSTKKGKKVWVEWIINPKKKTISFEVKTGEGNPPAGSVDRRGATCICCDTPVPFDYIRNEGKAGRMAAQLMAIVTEGRRGRVYLSPSEEHEVIAAQAKPENVPDTHLPQQALGFRVQLYGMIKHRDLFTSRQLVALTTFSDLVSEVRESVRQDAVAVGLRDDGVPLNDGGTGAQAYADAVATYLAFAVDRCGDFNNSLCRWSSSNEKVMNLFARQAIPMVWDFAEANIFADSVGGWSTCCDYVAECINVIIVGTEQPGKVFQLDATSTVEDSGALVSTDPPYYDNIGYADLSDFFYVWLRRTLNQIYPNILNTVLVPKTQELVAVPYRFDGDKEKAKIHFESGFRKAFTLLKEKLDPRFPMTVYYAFKQDEEADADDEFPADGVNISTGWETLLEALISTGFQITATWPVRASQKWRMVSMGTNALASYIILACRPRPEDAPIASRRDFITDLNRQLPSALSKLQQGAIAPVDLAQASIGPGMAVFSRYSQVVEADGSPMRVRKALALINQALDEFLAEQEGEFDSDTRWALAGSSNTAMRKAHSAKLKP